MSSEVTPAVATLPVRAARGREVGPTAVEFGGLTQVAGFMVRLAQLHLFEAFYREFGERGVTPGQIGILMMLGQNPGLRQGVLAQALRIKRSNMAKIVRLLDREGLITRRVPSTDRRAVELRLTPRGKALVERISPQIAASDRAATAMLSDGERATLLRLLARMAHLDGSGAASC
jgi:DNA-binding MarR family transcriptional regulator